ncbi:MAG: NTP transferase domain-containing protein [Candidatus Omnitrophica bacterium]|nr:NTP transferase domain-containing protein [Candidatus Omnitrophota bacterium]
MSNKSTFYGLVLVGGRSRRMKKDKALLDYHGQKQFEHCYHLLGHFCEKVFLSVREEQEKQKRFQKYPMIVDQINDIGPLGGILSAFELDDQVPWIVLACDLPFVTEQTLKNLIKTRDPQKIATSYLSVHDGLPEPLCAIYEPSAKKCLSKFLKKNIFCPRKILIQSNAQLIPLRQKAALDNINSRQDYDKALKSLKTICC